MSVSQAPIHRRGLTLFGPSATIDTNVANGINCEGYEQSFNDVNPVTGAQRSARPVICRYVKNASAITLYAGQAVTQKSGKLGQVDGLACLTATGPVLYVDEYLTTAGVRAGDWFWAVVRGPRLVLTDLAGGANNLIPAGTVLVTLTAATSGATTGGRVAPQDLTGATALLGAQVQYALGFAVSAKTTGQTNATLLVDDIRW